MNKKLSRMRFFRVPKRTGARYFWIALIGLFCLASNGLAQEKISSIFWA